MKVECDFPPALAVVNGKKYIMPLWQEVPMATTLADVEWTKVTVKPENPILAEKFVTGSTGNEYLVRVFKDGKGECECWGYISHKKDCKHIRKVKQDLS